MIFYLFVFVFIVSLYNKIKIKTMKKLFTCMIILFSTIVFSQSRVLTNRGFINVEPRPMVVYTYSTTNSPSYHTTSGTGGYTHPPIDIEQMKRDSIDLAHARAVTKQLQDKTKLEDSIKKANKPSKLRLLYDAMIGSRFKKS